MVGVTSTVTVAVSVTVAVAVAETAPDYAYSGAQLKRIAAGEFDAEDDLAAAKRLLRSILAHYLGDRPLKTRRVLAAMNR